MALINCTECGKQISDRSVACIYCGCPMSEIKKDIDLIKQKQMEEERKRIEAERKAYEEQQRIKREQQRERWEQERKLREERKKAEEEALLKRKKETQEHINWNNIFSPLSVCNPLTREWHKLSYYDALLTEPQLGEYIKDSYYVIPEIDKYVKENILLEDKWDFIYDVFNKRSIYGFKLTWTYIIKSVRNGFFVFQNYSKSESEFVFNHGSNTLNFTFKPEDDSFFCLNGIKLNLSIEKQETLLKELSLKCFEQYKKIVSLRKKCKDIAEKKKEPAKMLPIGDATTSEQQKPSMDSSQNEDERLNKQKIQYNIKVNMLKSYLCSGKTLVLFVDKSAVIKVEVKDYHSRQRIRIFDVSHYDRISIYIRDGRVRMLIRSTNNEKPNGYPYIKGYGKLYIDDAAYDIPCEKNIYI